MTLRGAHWGRFLAFLVLTCGLIGALIGRRAGVAVGVIMGVLWAVIISVVTGVVFLRAKRQRGHQR